MSPRGGKCARVGKVASKGRQTRAQHASLETTTTTTMSTTTTITTTATMVTTSGTAMATSAMMTSSGTAVAATRMDKPAVTTACEGRSHWSGRMRQSLESSSEPRENGTPVLHRYPERQRRRERHGTGRKHRPARNNGSSCSSTSLSSPPALSSPSSCASSRRSTSPPSSTSSPARSSTSTASTVASDPLAIKAEDVPIEHAAGIGKQEAGTSQDAEETNRPEHNNRTVHGVAETTASAPTSSTIVSSSSPFPSPVSTSSASCRTSTPRGYCDVAHASSSALERLRSTLESYDRSRIYLAHVCYLDWRDLPGKRRDTRSSERVWVVGAADHEGHHRTRLLVAGRHWRPRCLRKVNMLSQPVVYAGGGRGSLTADLFLWWFHHEFAVTAMAMHPDGAVLVAESADYLPPEGDCVAADGLVRLFVVPKDCMETRLVVRELRVRLATGVLSRARCGLYRDNLAAEEAERHRLDAYLRRFTLKEAFADLHRAWLSVRSETFARSWTLPREREDHPLAGCSTANGAILPPRIYAVDQEEDRMLLVELQSLAREAGLDAGDEELGRWIVDEESALARLPREPEEEQQCRVKIELEDRWSERTDDEDGNNDGAEDEDAEDEPTAEEAVGLLSRVLTWMEREPLDPGLLLAVRSMRDTAALMASKMGLTGTHPSGLPFFCPNGDHLTQPPPAHMGIPPYAPLDAGKAAAAAGLSRAPMYPFSTSQYPYPMLSPEMTQVAATWHTPSMYPISPANAGFRSPYPTSLPITSSSLSSDLYRFSPTGLMPPHPGLSPHAHALASHALVSSAPKADHSTLDHNHRSTIEQKNSTSLPTDNAKAQDTGQQNNQDKKKPHIKKPLNAFMLYMKEMRAKVVAECTLKESAAINQILGRRWHSLSREEQARYYEAARQERHLHQQRYPGWSARDNYGYGSKKKKRKKERSADPTGGNNMKKCRARYGLDQQNQWCKPCRRKKKCIRYMGEGGDGDGEADGEGEDDHSEDNLGSVGEAGTPEDDESLSSPGGLSALSSLASPSLVLPSPSSLASPYPCPLTPPVPPPPLPNTSQHNPATSTTTAAAVAVTTAATTATATATAVVQQPPPPPHRNPVGTNPHDINNPLSVNQLTGQCIKSEPAPSGPSNPAISVA
ncbi:PREDICTED: uncharacterized protein LOC106742176 isoform X2 [Dinoponera quadriceps]|uniref:dTCF n=1 Tax=Dinoponera quadriceps TaxID=609295 RepID=A0A6P3WW83_DINQU|nr:PREDICTED: uncharacterized protein LOC106742176 isoform X2 [Dinoponera quadriceps]